MNNVEVPVQLPPMFHIEAIDGAFEGLSSVIMACTRLRRSAQ